MNIKRRSVTPHDVEIEILYCGICHSDLHAARNEWHNTVYATVPGHEIVGRVTSVGDQVTNFKVGDLYLGTQTYGGYSESIVVDENYALRVPDNLDLAAAAPLLCGGITTYSPLKQKLPFKSLDPGF